MNSNTDKSSDLPKERILYSVCTAHMTYDRSVFSNYSNTPLTKIDIGSSSTADVVGQEDINITRLVKV